MPADQLRLGLLCATSGNSGPSARQTPEGGSSTRRSTDYALHLALFPGPTQRLVPRPHPAFCHY